MGSREASVLKVARSHWNDVVVELDDEPPRWLAADGNVQEDKRTVWVVVRESLAPCRIHGG